MLQGFIYVILITEDSATDKPVVSPLNKKQQAQKAKPPTQALICPALQIAVIS